MFSGTLERMFVSRIAIQKRRRELDAAEAAWLADVAEYHHSGDWSAEHFLNAAAAIADACHMDSGVAQEYVTLARKLEKLPAVAEAFAAGDISARHARVVATAHTRGRAEQLAPIEEHLADLAKEMKPSEFGAVVRRYTDAIDGDGGAENEEALFARRRLHLSRSLDDLLNVNGLFDPESADILQAAVDAEIERDQRAGDDRTMGQRRADALTNLLRMSLERGEVGNSHGVRPHVMYVVHLDTAEQTGTGGLVDLLRTERRHSGRLSSSSLDRIMCDCDVTRVVMTGKSEILDIGRATRTPTAAQWKALVIRDQHCQAPGCTQPPHRCQAHHDDHWEHGGPTNLNNLKLYCWHHDRDEHKHDNKHPARDRQDHRRDTRTRSP